MVNRVIGMRRAIGPRACAGDDRSGRSLAADGKKHFKEGVRYEENRQWDKAAEKFALAVAEKPSNVEYQLHFQRALVQRRDNAGRARRHARRTERLQRRLSRRIGRHIAFDPTNELACIKMRNMLEVQGLPTDTLPSSGDPAGPKLQAEDGAQPKASFIRSANGIVPPRDERAGAADHTPRAQVRQDRCHRPERQPASVIEQLAQDMGLNVIFDTQVITQMRNNEARHRAARRDQAEGAGDDSQDQQPDVLADRHAHHRDRAGQPRYERAVRASRRPHLLRQERRHH